MARTPARPSEPTAQHRLLAVSLCTLCKGAGDVAVDAELPPVPCGRCRGTGQMQEQVTAEWVRKFLGID